MTELLTKRKKKKKRGEQRAKEQRGVLALAIPLPNNPVKRERGVGERAGSRRDDGRPVRGVGSSGLRTGVTRDESSKVRVLKTLAPRHYGP